MSREGNAEPLSCFVRFSLLEEAERALSFHNSIFCILLERGVRQVPDVRLGSPRQNGKGERRGSALSGARLIDRYTQQVGAWRPIHEWQLFSAQQRARRVELIF